MSPAAPAAGVTPRPGGFRKCNPPNHLPGEFGTEDIVGLSARAPVATDCKVHWSDEHGTTYCFATSPSLPGFRDHTELLPKAESFWRKSHP